MKDELSITPEDSRRWVNIQLSNGRFLRYIASNARIIEIHTNCIVEESYLENKELLHKEITSLNFSDVYNISVGDEFNTKIQERDYKYKIGYISKIKKNRYVLGTHLRNRSSIYITPILGGVKGNYLYDWYLINSYIGIKDTDTEDYIYLMYRFMAHAPYLRFEQEIIKHSLFVNKKDIDKRYTLFKFKVPEHHKEDVKLFRRGKYSKFSDILKRRILAFHGMKYDLHDRVVGTLHKSKELKNKLEDLLACTIDESIDLDSIPNLEEEML